MNKAVQRCSLSPGKRGKATEVETDAQRKGWVYSALPCREPWVSSPNHINRVWWDIPVTPVLGGELGEGCC